jgi:hypothetical protein
MTIEDRTLLYDIMRSDKLVYWQIFDNQNTKPVLFYDEIFDVERSITLLNKALDSIGSGYCKVTLSKLRRNEKKGGNLRDVNVTYNVKCGKEIKESMQSGSSVNLQYIQEIDNLKRQIIEIKNQHDKEKLIERIEDLENYEEEDEGGLNGITKKLTPHLPLILSKLLGIDIMGSPAPAINGAEIVTEDISTQEDLCNQACMQLLQIDKEAGTHLMMLANLCATNKQMYDLALSQLKTL